MLQLTKTTVLIFALIFALSNHITGQTRPGRLLSDTAFNVLLNKSISKFLTGQQNTIANFASFDPSNSKFLLNGVLSLKDSTKRNMNLLSFSIAGGLIDGNATTLFSDKKLNTDVNIDLKFHIVSNWNKRIHFFRTEREKKETKFKAIRQDSVLGRQKFELSISEPWLQKQREALQWKFETIRNEYSELEQKYSIVRDSITNIRATPNPNQIRLKYFSDSAQSLVKKINAKFNERFACQSQIDSLNLIDSTTINRLEREFNRQIQKTTNEKLLNAELEAKVNALQYSWFSILAGFNRRKYYTYYSTLPFSNRLTKNSLDGFNVGLEWNYLFQGYLIQRTHYFNVGFVNRRYNNLDDLSTTEVEQEIKNSSTDTTRKITKKYASFTDPVENFRSWFLYSNYYLFWGKSYKTGIHIFPEYEIRNNGTNLFNTGFGFIVSLKDEKKDKNILNIETYTRFLDIGNQLKTEDKFYERLEIGIRVGLPIKPF